MSSEPHLHGSGESYSGVVLTKHPNKSGRPWAEGAEGRPLTKENTGQPDSCRTESRGSEPSGLAGVPEAARRDGKLKFTALLHQVTVDLLRDSYGSLQKQAAPGVDGVTWEESGRIHSGAFRAQPSRRVWIPIADGRQPPFGMAALEDKIAQYAVGTVLNPIWEEEMVAGTNGGWSLSSTGSETGEWSA